jgi:glycogen phosphorylase
VAGTASATKLDPFVQRTDIAYFSMEIALRPEMRTYSGGLGVLAGDTARSCADLELPVVFVTLVSRSGYLRQEIDAAGRQVDHPDPWDIEAWTEPLGAMIAVPIEGREVWIRPRFHAFSSPLGHRVPILLLDTNLDQNGAEDRTITDRLYGGDAECRLKQEIILGIGGVRVLQALGFHINTYHMNEGHAALLSVQLLRQFRRRAEDVALGESAYDPARVRHRCVFTTHTPVEAAQDRFSYDLVARLLGDYVEIDGLKKLAGADALNMTQLALNLSGYINGVARRHAETTHRLFPGYHVRAVTNGVHPQTWTHAAFARLYQAAFPQWLHEPEALSAADQLADDAVWSAHQQAKQDLLALIKARSGADMRPEIPLIGFARRMTGYKRPDLLFTDIERLTVLARQHPFQLVFAGKAHPRDEPGKRLIEQLNQHIRQLCNIIPMAFLPDYDVAIAATLVAGADIWLNTPLPPLEASGTSGMKAAFNGVLNLSVLDGWWVEACIEGVTGWAIGGEKAGSDSDHADALYRKLGEVVLPLYYGDRTRWIWMMKQGISKIGAYFNSQRMMRRYATEAYLR